MKNRMLLKYRTIRIVLYQSKTFMIYDLLHTLSKLVDPVFKRNKIFDELTYAAILKLRRIFYNT